MQHQEHIMADYLANFDCTEVHWVFTGGSGKCMGSFELKIAEFSAYLQPFPCCIAAVL